MGSLKKRLQKETQYHKDDNLNVMDQNLSLIKEIKKLRGSVKTLKSNIRNIQGKLTSSSAVEKGLNESGTQSKVEEEDAQDNAFDEQVLL